VGGSNGGAPVGGSAETENGAAGEGLRRTCKRSGLTASSQIPDENLT
jgi:hypothetical protein